MSAAQIGYAARMRTRVHGKDRRWLNKIVHSPDVSQGKYGKNPFDKNWDWDDGAQERLESIAAGNGFADVLYDLRVTVFSHRAKMLLKAIGNLPRDELQERERMHRQVEEIVDGFVKVMTNEVESTTKTEEQEDDDAGDAAKAAVGSSWWEKLYGVVVDLMKLS